MSSGDNCVMVKLWFDVEKRYKTINGGYWRTVDELWFDVEKRYKTMFGFNVDNINKLWFDVEKRYKTILTGNTRSLALLWFDVEKDIRQWASKRLSFLQLFAENSVTLRRKVCNERYIWQRNSTEYADNGCDYQ